MSKLTIVLCIFVIAAVVKIDSSKLLDTQNADIDAFIRKLEARVISSPRKSKSVNEDALEETRIQKLNAIIHSIEGCKIDVSPGDILWSRECALKKLKKLKAIDTKLFRGIRFI